MLKEETLNLIFSEVTNGAKTILGDRLKRVILYGSYARGDFHEGSDVDIMILADIPGDDAYRYEEELCLLSSRLDLKHDAMIMIYVKDQGLFEKYLPALPFYQSVVRDGKVLI
jgi:predicted nucleotidyltransferase